MIIPTFLLCLIPVLKLWVSSNYAVCPQDALNLLGKLDMPFLVNVFGVSFHSFFLPSSWAVFAGGCSGRDQATMPSGGCFCPQACTSPLVWGGEAFCARGDGSQAFQ